MPESNFSLIITRNENVLTQRSVVEYLSCLLDENMSGEAMARMVFNGKKKFHYRQRTNLSYPIKKMLCNTLVQPLSDFACCSWYLNMSMPLKAKLQTTQNSCIRYCFVVRDKSHFGKNEFEKN